MPGQGGAITGARFVARGARLLRRDAHGAGGTNSERETDYRARGAVDFFFATGFFAADFEAAFAGAGFFAWDFAADAFAGAFAAGFAAGFFAAAFAAGFAGAGGIGGTGAFACATGETADAGIVF